MPKRVLIPLPDTDFDTTEVAVPWRLLVEAGHEVVFATERAGIVPSCDPLLLTGVLFGQLGAEPEPKQFYDELTRAPEFNKTIAWGTVDVSQYDALLLPGGHAKGMRQYLGSTALQSKVVEFVKTGKPFAAICHGPLVLARSIDGEARSGTGPGDALVPRGLMDPAAVDAGAGQIDLEQPGPRVRRELLTELAEEGADVFVIGWPGDGVALFCKEGFVAECVDRAWRGALFVRQHDPCADVGKLRRDAFDFDHACDSAKCAADALQVF